METVEGEKDEFGHVRLGGSASASSTRSSRAPASSRAPPFSATSSGGTPTAFDPVLATRPGLAAVDAADGGRRLGHDAGAQGHPHRAAALRRGGGPAHRARRGLRRGGDLRLARSAAPAPCARAAGRWRGSRAGARSERAHRRPRAGAGGERNTITSLNSWAMRASCSGSGMPLPFTCPSRARPNRVSIMCEKRSPGVISTRTRVSRSLAFHQSCQAPGSITAVSPSRRMLVCPSSFSVSRSSSAVKRSTRAG